MVENLPSLAKDLKMTDSRNTAYHKKDKLKETFAATHHNQTAENQRKKISKASREY